MNDDEPPVLDDAALEALPAAEPPPGFADRVLAARNAPPRRRLPIGWIAAGLIAAAAVTLFVTMRGPREHGTVASAKRAEERIGERAVAVIEPGADLSWVVEPSGAVRVTQSRGNVFYRVEHGGPFVVVTPAGEVSVLGTCFRVEVTEMKIGKQALGGAVVGAAVTAVVMVTAYEGRVLLANEKGRTQIVAGERGTVSSGAAPGPAVDARIGKKPMIVVTEAPPPPTDASREALLARDAEQRKKIASLEQKVAELQAGGGGGDAHFGRGPRAYATHPTHDELVDMAKSCTVAFDNPPLDADPTQLPAKIGARAGLSTDETVAVQKVIDQTKAQTLAQLRALYVEVTGNTGGAEELSPQALMHEIDQKTGSAESDAARKQIAGERAGLAQVPTDLSTRTPSERMLRLLSSEGDDLEKAIAQVIGPERAAALRGEGWGNRSMMSGCRDSPGDDEEKR